MNFLGRVNKMKIDSKVIAVALIFGATISPVMAENFYGALDLGQSTAKDACTGFPAGWTGCEETATMYRIAGGYQFTPMWGAEVSYGDLGKPSVGSGILLGIPVSGNYEASSFQVSATGSFPLGDAFSLIGKVGIARTDVKVSLSGGGVSASESDTTTNLAYGIGAQYAFTEKVSVRAQYEDLGTVGDSNTTGTAKVTLLSAGVVYKF
jgi:OOP family OmpA-OmpF porin